MRCITKIPKNFLSKIVVFSLSLIKNNNDVCFINSDLDLVGVQSCAAEFAERLLKKLFDETGLEYLAQIRLTDNVVCQDCEHVS